MKWQTGVLFSFWAVLFIRFLTPMELGDIWWHLKTGQWIWQEKALPSLDLFSLAGGDLGFTGTSFWLCQALLYGVYRLSGLWGVVALKAALFGGAFFLLERLIHKHYGLGRPVSLIALVPAILMASFYDEIRPQTFSFFFFALTLYLLESRPKRLVWLLPPVLLIWANMHGGYVLGAGLTGLYILRDLVRGRAKEGGWGLVLPGAAAIAASLINPNGAEAFRITAGFLRVSAGGSPMIHEHLPMREFAAFTGERGIVILAAVMGILGLGLWISGLLFQKRKNFFLFALFAGFACASLISFRAGFFFALLATAFIGKTLAGGGKTLAGGGKTLAGENTGLAIKARRAERLSWAALAALVLLSAPPALRDSAITNQLINNKLFPAKAAEFLDGQGLPGNLFHPYEWGGYLIWQLHPRYKVFIDGRAVGLMGEYRTVLRARQGWRQALERHGVNTVLYWPILPYEGYVPPLIFALLKDEGWSPVYWDLRSLIFVRAGLARNPLPKGAVWELLTSLAAEAARSNPENPDRWACLAEVYIQRGMPAQARQALQSALRIDPENRKALSLAVILR